MSQDYGEEMNEELETHIGDEMEEATQESMVEIQGVAALAPQEAACVG